MNRESKKSILIVEDDPEFAQLLEEGLLRAGFRVLKDQGISGALFKINNQKFDCMVFDVRIKQGDATTLLPLIRKDRTRPNSNTPIFLMSGHLDRKIIEASAGLVSGIFAKPFEIDQLVQKVIHAVGMDGATADAHTRSDKIS